VSFGAGPRVKIQCHEVDGAGRAAGRAREEAEVSKRASAHAVPPANQPLPQLGISSAVSENLMWVTCIELAHFC